MATAPVSRNKKANSKLKNLSGELSREIGERAEKLSANERKRRHEKLLEIANRGPK